MRKILVTLFCSMILTSSLFAFSMDGLINSISNKLEHSVMNTAEKAIDKSMDAAEKQVFSEDEEKANNKKQANNKK